MAGWNRYSPGASGILDPFADFMSWMSGGDAIDKSANQQMAGLAKGERLITDATKESRNILAPYMQGGKEDYDNYRAKANSGYYNTPFSGSYQAPQAPQNQQFKPQWNAQTQSYDQAGPNYQTAQRGPVTAPSLPPWMRPPVQVPTQPQGPAQQQVRPFQPPQPNTMPPHAMDAVMQGTKLTPTPNPVNSLPPEIAKILEPFQNQPGAQMGSSPFKTMSPQDLFNLIRSRGGIGSGPMVPYGGRMV